MGVKEKFSVEIKKNPQFFITDIGVKSFEKLKEAIKALPEAKGFKFIEPDPSEPDGGVHFSGSIIGKGLPIDGRHRETMTLWFEVTRTAIDDKDKILPDKFNEMIRKLWVALKVNTEVARMIKELDLNVLEVRHVTGYPLYLRVGIVLELIPTGKGSQTERIEENQAKRDADFEQRLKNLILDIFRNKDEVKEFLKRMIKEIK